MSSAAAPVLILGYGAIGGAVAARLEPFGVEIIRVARRARAGVHAVDELDALLPRADVVVVLVPLTPATVGLIDAGALARLPQGALLVNAARGTVVDTDALLAALRAERIRAVLDVTDPEPLPADHPAVGRTGRAHHASFRGRYDRRRPSRPRPRGRPGPSLCARRATRQRRRWGLLKAASAPGRPGGHEIG